MKCELPYWPVESWWGTAGVFGSCVAEICVKETQNILKDFHLCFIVTSIRASCWNVVGAHSTKSGRRSMWLCPVMAYCPITQVSMWVSVLMELSESITLLKRPHDSSCLIVTTAVWLGRTTCWTSPGKRWTCCEWQWRCLGKDHLVLYPPVAFQLDSMDGSKMCQDLKVSAEVKESFFNSKRKNKKLTQIFPCSVHKHK